MEQLSVTKEPIPWWAAGLILGLVQILAVSLTKPLGVSTQFVVADAKAIARIAPEYAIEHPLISKDKYGNLIFISDIERAAGQSYSFFFCSGSQYYSGEFAMA